MEQSLALSCLTKIGAWESAGEEVNCFEFSSVNSFDVLVAIDALPVAFQYLPAKVIDFDLPFTLHSGSLQAKINPADAGK
jgi:hypothetical protein